MKQQKSGSIVNTASVAGLIGSPGMMLYNSSKHALMGINKVAALEAAEFNVRVNTVNPGVINTRMMRSIEENVAPGAAEAARSGLGQSSTLQLAKEGAKLVLVDVNQAGLDETNAKVKEVAPNAETLLLTANVADEKAVEKAIAPGAIMTPMVEGSLRQMGGENWEEVGKEFVQSNPMKRFGKPEEIGYLVAFLLSNQADFINGEVIAIDGGQSYKY